ncbi:MAG: NUDIX domain-containing protein [Campylobacterales bacterium]|nr:NUDIX domain-containing protein [Campylobacterales bacterium]
MKITDFSLQPLTEPRFVFTSLATYRQNGIQKSWEIVKAHDSAAVLLYHKTKNAFVLVKQFRPATYANAHTTGMSIELCAGIVDKNLSLEKIIQEEILEECGYDVGLSHISKITSFYTSVGFAGSKQTLYYAEIDESMMVSSGGGVDNEMIEVIYLDINEAKKLMFDDDTIKTPGLLFAFAWWFDKRGIVI